MGRHGLDIQAIRAKEFPLTQSWAYLDHATHGTLPRRHVAAAARFLHDLSETAVSDLLEIGTDGVDRVRERAGQLLHCPARNIAFLKSTSEGIDLVAQGLDWKSGDEVISYELEFPTCVYPWLALASRGVTLRMVADYGRHRFEVEDVAELMSPRTRVVCLSLVNFGHGFRAPLEEIGKLCRERDIWFVVDAVQGLGALQVDVSSLGADIISAHGYKFLLSGFGVAVCYCSDRAIRRLVVPQVGWKNVDEPTRVGRLQLDFAQSARRFESAWQNFAGLLGMHASLELLLEVGPAPIENRVLDLSAQVATGLSERGYDVLSSQRQGERSAIVSAIREGVDYPSLRERMLTNRVACAVLEGRLRVSPHFYNTEDDIGRLLDSLPR